jgi:hypothetical protein
MQTINLNLSKPQFGKLLNGETVQVTRKQMNHGDPVHLSTRNSSKVSKAFHNNKGTRLSLTQAEMKANSDIVGGKFNLKKQVRNGSNKVAKFSNKANKVIRKADGTIQKIDYIVDQGEIIGDLGIPYVSPAYKALDMGTDALATASHATKKLSNKSNTAVQSGNNVIQARTDEDRARYGEDFKRDVANVGAQYDRSKGDYVKAFNQASSIGGAGVGVNPYMPKKLLRKTVRGPDLSGGSGVRMGGSFRVIGSGVKLQTDDSNIVGPNHNSFNPIKPESYSGGGAKSKHKCPNCGHAS